MRLFLFLAVCLVPSFSQTPPGGSGAPPTNPAASTGSPSIAPALPISPAKKAPTSGTNNPPPRASPPRGVGIFNAPFRSPWGIPPPEQQWGRPQSYPSPNMSPGFRQNTGWAPQPQPNLMQGIQLLRNMQTMNTYLDRMDVPCGMSRRRQQSMMFMGAVEQPDPYCECRIGGCDGLPDFSGQSECSAFGAACCCSGTPYNSLLTATLMGSNALGAQGPGAFNPYAVNPQMMQPNPYQRGGMNRPSQNFPPQTGPRRMPQVQRTQPPTVQDFRTMWFR